MAIMKKQMSNKDFLFRVLATAVLMLCATAVSSYAATISGRVLYDNGDGVKDVNVSIAFGKSGRTNSLGSYTIYNVEDGTYTVTPDKTGFTFRLAMGTFSSRVTVENGRNVYGINFETPTYSVSGKVVNHIGDGVGGVTVKATQSGWAKEWTSTALFSGRYKIDELHNGESYTIIAEKSGYTFVPDVFVRSSFTIRGQDVSDINFVATEVPPSKRETTIRGEVIFKNIYPLSDYPIKGAKIKICNGKLYCWTPTVTDSHGRYSYSNFIEDTPGGTFENTLWLIVEHDKYKFIPDEPIENIYCRDKSSITSYLGKVFLGENTKIIRFEHSPDSGYQYTFNYKAERLYTLSGILVYRDGTAIRGIKVYACSLAEPVSINSGGEFTQSKLEPADFWFVALPIAYNWEVPDGDDYQWLTNPTDFGEEFNAVKTECYLFKILKTDQDISGLTFIAENPVVKGCVKDGGKDGTPLEGVTVELTSDGETLSRLTDSSGEYEFTGLYNGSYTISASDTGHPDYDFGPERTVEVQKTTVQDFYTYTISGQVVDGAGKGINGVEVIMDDPTRGGDSPEYTTVTGDGPHGETGYYEQRVTSGTYDVETAEE